MIWLAHFSNLDLAENLTTEPNKEGDPFKNVNFFLFQMSKCMHVSSIKMKVKMSDTNGKATAVAL